MMTDTEKWMMSVWGMMVFGVLLGSQVLYLILKYSLALYFQMALTTFWLGFSIATYRKIKRRKDDGKNKEE